MKVLLVDWQELRLNEELDRLLPLLPLAEQDRIKRLRMSPDRIRGAVSAVLARSMAMEAFPGQSIRILRTEKGRPFVEGKEGFDFNISHSGDLVVYVSAFSPVGVDTEQVKEIKPERFKRFFSEEETEEIQKSEDPKDSFFRFWTVREALFKLLGEGLSLLEERCEPDLAGQRIFCRGKEYFYSSVRYKDHWISLCTEERVGEMELCPLHRKAWEAALERLISRR